MFFVIFSSILEGSILKVFSSGSTGTIVAPTFEIDSHEAMYAFEATITSSFSLIFKALKEIIKASIPEPTPIENLTLLNFCN